MGYHLDFTDKAKEDIATHKNGHEELIGNIDWFMKWKTIPYSYTLR